MAPLLNSTAWLVAFASTIEVKLYVNAIPEAIPESFTPVADR